MDFVIGLLISTNQKNKNYDFIRIIVNQLTKIIYYKLVKLNMDALRLVQVICDVIVWHHSLFDYP